MTKSAWLALAQTFSAVLWIYLALRAVDPWDLFLSWGAAVCFVAGALVSWATVRVDKRSEPE